MSIASILSVFVGIIVLGVLIFVHELGHFLLAKWNGVAVVEFAIGFGKKIWSKRIGETRYSIGAIPLGGYVRMVGDNPFEQEDASTALQAVEDLPPELAEKFRNEKHRWFLKQGFFPKASIVIAGPLFNILFAWILAIVVIFVYGDYRPSNEPLIGEVMADMPAEKAGLKKDDRVLQVNGAAVITWAQMSELIQNSASPINLKVKRINEVLDINVGTQEENKELQLLSGSKAPSRQLIGIRPVFEDNVSVSVADAFKYGTLQIYATTVMSVRGIWYMIVGSISTKNIGGPITIMKEAASSASHGLERLAKFMIFLSISLAVINLMPIPILDGGHLMFFVFELLIGVKNSLKIQQYANQVGMLLLFGLMLFAIWNDIFNLVIK